MANFEHWKTCDLDEISETDTAPCCTIQSTYLREIFLFKVPWSLKDIPLPFKAILYPRVNVVIKTDFSKNTIHSLLCMISKWHFNPQLHDNAFVSVYRHNLVRQIQNKNSHHEFNYDLFENLMQPELYIFRQGCVTLNFIYVFLIKFM